MRRLPVVLVVAGVAALGSGCSSDPPLPPSRPACLADLVHAYDVDGMVNHSQTDTLGAAHRAIDGARRAYGEALAHLTPEQRSRYDAATDRFVMAARAAPDASQAAAVWAQAYGANLSDAEACQIADFAHTPTGGELFANADKLAGLSGDDLKLVTRFVRTPAGAKEGAASATAAVALRNWLAQERSTSIEQAAQRYLAELRTIIGY